MRDISYLTATRQEAVKKLYVRAVKSKVAAIKLMCLECFGYDGAESKACECRDCPLWYQTHKSKAKKAAEVKDVGGVE